VIYHVNNKKENMKFTHDERVWLHG
jgi:hypothetical protein